MARDVQEDRTSKNSYSMQHMLKQIQRGALDETHTHAHARTHILISIAAIFRHHFNV